LRLRQQDGLERRISKVVDMAGGVIHLTEIKFREMLESSSGGEIWPRGAVTILSPDFAKKADILECLTQVSWDLVIADEAHGLRGSRAAAIKLISASAERVVLASATPPTLFNPLEGEDSTVIEWRRDRLVNSHGGRLFESTPRPILHEVSYTLTTAELSLRHAVHQLCNVIRGISKPGSLIENHIIGSLESSLPALENTLRRVTDRSTIEVEWLTLSEYSDEDEPEDNQGIRIQPEPSGDVARLAAQALEMIEQISVDSKLNAFGELLSRLGNQLEPSRVCVLTNYLKTLFYLNADIEGRNLNCTVVHGGMSIEDLKRSLTSFTESEGLLVATVASLQGMEFAVTDLVLYDVPRSKALLYPVLARFRESGRQGQLHLHVFRPTNGTDGPLQSLRNLLNPNEEMFSG
jgi:hypothetical protein